MLKTKIFSYNQHGRLTVPKNQDLEHSAFLGSSGINFLSQLYCAYLSDPASVDPSWQQIFTTFQDQKTNLTQDLQKASWATMPQLVEDEWTRALVSSVEKISAPTADAHLAIQYSLRALMLIRAYRVRGHLAATLDPLHLTLGESHPELDPASYGFTTQDYDHPIFIDGILGQERATLREILNTLQRTYSGTVGIEYMHIQDPEQKLWLQTQFENHYARFQLSEREKKAVLQDLIRAEGFELFLRSKYPGAVRFGLEGSEALIPAMQQIILTGAKIGVQDTVIGMAHRGRLNILANVLQKSARSIFAEFEGGFLSFEDIQSSGDVKYHLGCSTDREINGHKFHLSLTANPSHLEAVNPVVVGKVRAKQDLLDKNQRGQVVGLLLHGDAAIAGQGLVAETLSLAELPGYRVAGTLHLIINNQIGFTTSPKHSRSSPYSSDVAKMIQAPVLHVNGDDIEAVAFVSRLAMDFRQKFHKDVVIDLYGYRRYGHNEIDEPAFTQPKMYQAIAQHPSTYKIYREKLIQQGVVNPSEVDAWQQEYAQQLEKEYTASKTYQSKPTDWFDGKWSGYASTLQKAKSKTTGVAIKRLQAISKILTKIPKGFNIHPRLQRLLAEKEKKLTEAKNIDWATAEALAFGSLLVEEHPVRLSGQDSRRGTFSQRHAVFIDQVTEEDYIPLNHLQDDQQEFEVVDSPLSEASVMGFEYGYSLTNPQALVMWEAQFGDFANGAQVIIDQFICSGESKWQRMSGLVLLLPHGYEGQGPEHSSARLERFLQLSAQNNWQVVNCTTPANYFHVLRRQVKRNVRKPLIVMTPKSLLRNKLAVSSLADMGARTQFMPVLPEQTKQVAQKKVRRIILCSGKVYYDLWQARVEKKIKDIAIIRLEQLYPFPLEALQEALQPYSKQAEAIWCQEEPHNMGAWHYLDRLLEEVLVSLKFKGTRPIYMGHKELASTASGYAKLHAKAQQKLMEEALSKS